MSRCARQSGSGAVGSHHVLRNTGLSHYCPPCFNSPEALWMPTFVDSSCGFTKQEFWLNHGPVRTVPTLSVLSSPQSYKKNKPLSTPPRIPLTTGSTERFSMPCLWIVSTPRKDSKSKSCMRLVHGIKQQSNMDDKIVMNSGQMREKIWIIRDSQNRTWERAWRIS